MADFGGNIVFSFFDTKEKQTKHRNPGIFDLIFCDGFLFKMIDGKS